MRILVVDDDPEARRLLEDALGRLDHEVVLAPGGLAAWEAFQREHFDAVITDWLMSDLDGLELTRQIRAAARWRYTYVLLLSAMVGKGRYLSGMDAGADDIVAKPVDPEELHARLRVAERTLRLQDALREQAIRDPLTDLFNRRYMEESLDREVHRAVRRGIELSIVMVDLDHFKGFNDTFGHDAGDAVLCAVGQFLRSHTRAEDIACRYGGEEFTLILPEAPLDAAQRRAEQLRDEVAHLKVPHRGEDLGPVTLSMGVAAFPRHGPTGDAVLRAADAALYQAKREGRNRVVIARGQASKS